MSDSGSSVHGISQARIHWSGWPFPSPEDLPNTGSESTSPVLSVTSLPPHLLPPGETCKLFFFLSILCGLTGFLKLFIYLLLAVLGLHCYEGFPLVVLHGLLMTVASLVSEHGL